MRHIRLRERRVHPTGPLAPAVAVVLLAALLRLPTLGQQSFWLDEAATLNVLHRSLGALFPAIVHQESTPPLYYILAWAWSQVLGYSEFAVRLLPALFGIATVGVVYATAERLAGARAGVVTGILAALNPLLVWYSQEARSYSLLAFFGALSFYLAVRAIDATERSRPALWQWAIVAVLALGTHYFAVFFLAPQAAWLLWRQRANARLPVAAVSAIGLALLALALKQRASGRTDWITGSPLHTRLALIPKQFVTGLSAPHQTLLAAVALLGALASIGMLVHQRRDAPQGALVAVGITVGAPIAMGVMAVLGVDLVLTRNAIGVLPIGLVAVGIGLDLLARSRLAVRAAAPGAAIAATSLVAVLAVIISATYQRTDWRDAARVLRTSPAPHLVVLDPSSAQLPLSVYVKLRRSPRGKPIMTREIDVLRFLLDIQGGLRSRGARLRIPAGFLPTSPHRWPGIEVERYLSPRAQPVYVKAAGARTLVIPVRR